MHSRMLIPLIVYDSSAFSVCRFFANAIESGSRISSNFLVWGSKPERMSEVCFELWGNLFKIAWEFHEDSLYKRQKRRIASVYKLSPYGGVKNIKMGIAIRRGIYSNENISFFVHRT